MGVAKSFKKYFLRGMAVLLPTILTIGILIWGFKFIQDNISVHINRGLVRLTMLIQGLDWRNLEARKSLSDFWIDGWGSMAGFLIALVIVCMVGIILASVVGKSLWRMVERFIMKTPFLRRIYPYIKQITDFFLTQADENKTSFSKVVAVEYPRKGMWSIGFVTGSGIKSLRKAINEELYTVFVPTSPTPFTGYVIIVPKEQTILLDFTMEEAFRYLVSGGVIAPDTDRLEGSLFPELKEKE